MNCLLYLLVTAFLVATSFDSKEAEALPLFGNARVFGVYCLATLPLAFVILSLSARLQSLRAWCGLASLGLIAVALMPQIAHLLIQADVSVVPRAVLRSVIAWLWGAPLAITLVGIIEPRPSSTESSRIAQRWLWAGAIAIILPAIYTQAQVSKLQQAVKAIAGSSRVASELANWNQVLELSGYQSIAGQKLRDHVRQLQRQFDELSTIASRPLPAPATIDDVQMRAIQLLSLNRATEAEKLIATFIDSSSQLAQDAYVSLRTLQAVAARESKDWNQVLKIAQSILVQNPDDQLARELQAEAYGVCANPPKPSTYINDCSINNCWMASPTKSHLRIQIRTSVEPCCISSWPSCGWIAARVDKPLIIAQKPGFSMKHWPCKLPASSEPFSNIRALRIDELRAVNSA